MAHHNEVIIAAAGIATTAASWFMGAKQRSKNESHDTLTKGANQIVETTNKLLEMAQRAYEEERQHRASCEQQLKELRQEIAEIKKK